MGKFGLFLGQKGRFWFLFGKMFFRERGVSKVQWENFAILFRKRGVSKVQVKFSKKIRYNGKNGLYHRTASPCVSHRDNEIILQDPLVLYGQQVTPENCKRKYAFQLSGSRCDVLLAAESSEKQRQWMTALGLASIGYQVRRYKQFCNLS